MRSYAVIVSEWNELVTNALRDGALKTLEDSGPCEVTIYQVPGAWEIPVLAAALCRKNLAQGIVALGCILQGETAHADLLAKDVSGALMRLQTETGVPIGWGIITPQNAEQALDRAGLKLGNKGREAAGAMLEMVELLEGL